MKSCPIKVEIVSAERKSPVLTPSKLECLAHMPSVDLTASWRPQDACTAMPQGYCSYPGRGASFSMQIFWSGCGGNSIESEPGPERSV